MPKTALALDRRDGVFLAPSVKAETTFNDLIRTLDLRILGLRVLSPTGSLDRTDDGFEAEGVVEVSDGRFTVTEALDRTAAFLRFFFDGFIEVGMRSVTALKELRDSPTNKKKLTD